jgi:hypothetical protein
MPPLAAGAVGDDGAVISAEARKVAEDLLRQAGFPGPLNVARVIGDDERIFVLPGDAVGGLKDQRGLEAALQQALGRKVWIVAASPRWSDTELFE